MPHRGQHEVRLLSVEPPPGEHPAGFDDHHPLVIVVQEVRSQLVTEQPTTGRSGRHSSPLPRMQITEPSGYDKRPCAGAQGR
jgi:hypothetical protein